MSNGAVDIPSMSQQVAKPVKSMSRKRQNDDMVADDQQVDGVKKTKKSRKSTADIESESQLDNRYTWLITTIVKPTIVQAPGAETPSPAIEIEDDDEDIFVPHVVKQAPEKLVWTTAAPAGGWPETAYDRAEDIFPRYEER
jgi:hypothetical protein